MLEGFLSISKITVFVHYHFLLKRVKPSSFILKQFYNSPLNNFPLVSSKIFLPFNGILAYLLLDIYEQFFFWVSS